MSLKKARVMAAQPGTLEQGMNVAQDGWFTELSSLWPGQGMSLKIDEVIFKGRSDFQVCHLHARYFFDIMTHADSIHNAP